MPIQVLILGLTVDGPTNEVLKFRDERDLLRLFGGLYTQRSVVSPSASSLSLDFDTYQTPQNVVNETLKSYLFSPYTSGGIYYFGTVGGSGNQTIDTVYTPYLGRSDLLAAVKNYRTAVGSTPWVGRVAGDRAKLTINGWSFEAKYAGSKYNDIAVSMGASGLTVFGMQPSFPALTYTSSSLWSDEIERDYRLGISPLRLVTASNTIFTGTFNCTGGSEGTLSADSLRTFLDVATIPSEVTHVLILGSATNALVQVVAEHLQQPNVQPRMFLFPAPAFSAPASSWATAMQSTLPVRHSLISFMVGDVVVNVDGVDLTRYGAEAAMIGLAAKEGYNATNTSMSSVSFTPVLTEAELNLLKRAGFMCPMRYIRSGISIYEGTTSASVETFLYSSKVAEIYGICTQYLNQFFGSALEPGDQPTIADALSSRLRQISFLRIESVQVELRPPSLYVTITAYLPSEILTISFTIKNR